MDWLAELNDTIEMESWFEIQSSDAKELRDFILEKDAEIERLREALKPFAKIADDYETLHDEDYVSVHRHDIELRHFRAIRSALQQKESE